MSSLRLISVLHKFEQNDKNNFVINNVNAEFSSDSSYAIVGISGSGKSTLLSVLAGIRKPTNGSVCFNSKNIEELDQSQYLNKTIGLVFQQPFLLKELSVIENVMLKGLISGIPFKEAKLQALELLEKLKLSHKSEEMPKRLSGGEQQRVSIARALFSNPDFLLADEPTAHLDEQNRDNVLDLLTTVKKNYKVGLIIATHDKAVSRICDKILSIQSGKLIPL